MQSITQKIKTAAAAALHQLFPEISPGADDILVNETKSEFAGDYSIVLFPFVKKLRQNPVTLGQTLGEQLQKEHEFISEFEAVSGFLNLTIADQYWLEFLNQMADDETYWQKKATGQKIMVEYSSPNTNKPLHFGHLRNNFLGWSAAEILKANGNTVIKANLVNDRGIHICKSMVAWKRYGAGATPESTGIKGDHLVGDYYVRFNEVYKEECAALMAAGKDKETAEKEAPILREAQELLRQWENGEPEVRRLWQMMNQWVYAGFDITYRTLGIDFDQMYYESDTYLLGKEIVGEGLKKGILYQKENGSVWIDLTSEGLDEKLLLRADGTSVYMTQDLGTARKKYEAFKTDQSIYVIGDEQNYHMQVLRQILEKLGEPYADGIFHLSYGMVELPSGKMKSREGTVVDADDMIAEMIRLAKEQSEQSGKTADLSDEEREALFRMIGLGALKFYLLRVDPKKKMIFDPKESIDLHGFTATFIQYAHARICSIIRKAGGEVPVATTSEQVLQPLEKALLLQLEQYPLMAEQAAKELNPALLCNYSFRLAQTFNSFFDQHSVLHADTGEQKSLRLMLAAQTAAVLRKSMSLLGISLPEKM